MKKNDSGHFLKVIGDIYIICCGFYYPIAVLNIILDGERKV